MSADDLADVLARMWAGFAGLARERVADVEAYAEALAAGRSEDGLRASAHAAAHKLAGALGSYGRPGSDQAGRLEVLLAPGAPAPRPDEVASLTRSLRAAVES